MLQTDRLTAVSTAALTAICAVCRCVQIMVASTAAFLAAGKFGLAPTVKNGTNAACKLQPRANAAGLITNDPSGAFGQLQQLALTTADYQWQ